MQAVLAAQHRTEPDDDSTRVDDTIFTEPGYASIDWTPRFEIRTEAYQS